MARSREFDEEAVLAAIADTFWTSGYAGTSLDDLLSATGLSKGSIYHAFGGKWSLFTRAFDDYCTRSVASVADHLTGPDEAAADRLRELFAVESKGEPSEVPRACLIAKTTAELGAAHPEVARRARDTFEALLEAIARTVKQAQRAGDVHATVEPQAAAALALTTLRGIEALKEAGVPGAVIGDAARLAMQGMGLTTA